MTLTIQKIIDGFKNTRDETYRRLCCLNKARKDIYFERINIECENLDQPQKDEFNKCQNRAYKLIGRMAALLAFGSDAGCAPNPHQELRDHLTMIMHKNDGMKNSTSGRHYTPQCNIDWMEQAIELLDKIEG